MSIATQISRIKNEVSNQSNLLDEINEQFAGQTNYAAILIGIMQKTITEYNDNYIQEIGESMLADCQLLTSINTPNLQLLHNYACKGNINLNSIYAPKLVLLGNSSLYNCGKITELITPQLQEIQPSALWSCKNLSNVDFSSVKIIENRGLYGCSNLTNLTLPKISYLGEYALQNTGITTLYLSNRTQMCQLYNKDVFSNTPITSGNGYVYVPSVIYDSYLHNSIWKSLSRYLKYTGEYPENITKTQYVLTSQTTEIRVPIYQYNNINDIQISNIDADTSLVDGIDYDITQDEIIFYITASSTISKTTLQYTISSQETFTRTLNLSIVDEIPAFSYSVVDLETTYGFYKNADGYYQSDNAKISNSYALCRVNFMGSGTARIIYMYEGETCCDYGIISNIDSALSFSTSDSTYLQKITTSGELTLTIETDCFIDIKYRKDGSVDTGSDSLQFMIVLE